MEKSQQYPKIEFHWLSEKTEKEFEQIRSQVNENIRDTYAKTKIRIFAPNYYAEPTIYGSAADK